MNVSSTEYKYWVFISFSHQDNCASRADGSGNYIKWANWLHEQLETFLIPDGYGDRITPTGETMPKRFFPTFRDEAELPCNADLGAQIREALERSRFLIVIASPRSARSRYVDEEVRYFSEYLGRRDRILTLIVAGTTNLYCPQFKPGSTDDDCFCPSLVHPLLPEDGVGITRFLNKEPLVADVRVKEIQPPREVRASERSQSDRRALLDFMKLKLIAGLMGVGLDELVQRDKVRQLDAARQRTKILRRWLTVVASLSLLVAIGGIVAWQMWKVAQENETKAKANEQRALSGLKEASRSDTATAQQHIAEGRWREAVAYLGRAIRYDPENQNARDAFWLALRHGERDGARPVRSLQHESGVNSASFSPDGARIVTASEDGSIRVWDAQSGVVEGKPLIDQGEVKSATFGPDGTHILTTSHNPILGDVHTVRVWDTQRGLSIGQPLKLSTYITSASFTPDGTRVLTTAEDPFVRMWNPQTGLTLEWEDFTTTILWKAVCSPDGTHILTAGEGFRARMWDAQSREPIGPELQHKEFVRDAEFSPDGSLIVTASGDHTAQIWNAQNGQIFCPALNHDGAVSNACFSPDGTLVITICKDTVRIWNAQLGQLAGPPLKHQATVISASFSTDGIRMLTVCEKEARVWDVLTGQALGPPLKHSGKINTARFSPDSRFIVTASQDRTAQVWDTRCGPSMAVPLVHDKDSVASARLNSDDTRIFTISSLNHYVRVWDAQTARLVSPEFTKEKIGIIDGATFNMDGTRFVAEYRDGKARMWDVQTSRVIGIPMQHAKSINHTQFSRDGARIVTGSQDHTAQVWDAKTGYPVGHPLRHEKGVTTVAFSLDGNSVVTTCSDKTARMWSLPTGEPRGAPLILPSAIKSADFSPDGTCVILVCSDYCTRIWHAQNDRGANIVLKHNSWVNCANFSLDGRRVITASADHTARIWDAQTGNAVGVPLLHEGSVTDAEFSPDGTRVVTSSSDKTARIWDAQSGQPLGSPLVHKDEVTAATFGFDGTHLLTTCADRTVRIWDVKPHSAIPANIAERMGTFVAGAGLDPRLGNLRIASSSELEGLWQALEPPLAERAEWLLLAEQAFAREARSARLSQDKTVTIRDAATCLIGANTVEDAHEALSLDPLNPLIPFAYANVEANKPSKEPANPRRAAWLLDYGMKRLPAETTAADLRLAANLVAEISKHLPEQKRVALTLLDRAAKLALEDEATRKLRESLKSE